MCSAKVAELMDILGVPDELDGTISMIQGWICANEVEKRSEQFQVQGFRDSVKEIWNKLKAYSKFYRKMNCGKMTKLK